MSDVEFDPRALAGVELLGRTGARNFRVGYTSDDDGEPTVWYAVATWRTVDAAHNVHESGAAEAAAAMNPSQAVLRLCDQVITGGSCAHCHQPTIFDENPSDTPFDALLDRMGCVYAWDPELSTFRRGCEGDQ